MPQKLLSELENKIYTAVDTIKKLRQENQALRQEISTLAQKLRDLLDKTEFMQNATDASNDASNSASNDISSENLASSESIVLPPAFASRSLDNSPDRTELNQADSSSTNSSDIGVNNAYTKFDLDANEQVQQESDSTATTELSDDPPDGLSDDASYGRG